MDRVIIGDVNSPRFVLDDTNITSVATRMYSALVGDEVRVDECDVITLQLNLSLYITADNKLYITADNKVYMLNVPEFKVPYGEVLRYYQNDALVGKFYVESVVRTSTYHYRVEAVSALGILDKQMHYGNVYEQVLFEDVVADIIGGAFKWTCTPVVAAIRVNNWLPYATKRENLHQLLFAYGVLLRKDSSGDLYFTEPKAYSETQISEAQAFIGGKVTADAPATAVELTVHAFKHVGSEPEEVLFDNTDDAQLATSVFVSFDKAPIYSLRTEGNLRIESSGVNFAIVTGIGVLYGVPYTHITRVVTANTGIAKQESKVVSITDAYLVNVTNANNVLKRMQSYYGTSQSISIDIVYDSEKPGDKIKLPHPFGGEVEAFISGLTLKSGRFIRAACDLLVGYQPGEAGNNYNNFKTYTADTNFVVPEGVTSIFVIVVGGGQGGYSGGKGLNGTAGDISGNTAGGTSGSQSAGTGGEGGLAGPGGAGGKILAVELAVTPGQSFSITIGRGGAGGVCSGETPTAGALGTPTTFGSISSETGTTSEHGFVDIFTGQLVGLPGPLGISPGGKGAGVNAGTTSITVLGVTYYSGAQGADAKDRGSGWSGAADGGFGGGPAHGANGNPGGDGDVEYNNGHGFVRGASGGAGANATVAGADAATPGSGGQGGSGGGGGGGNGACEHRNTNGMWPGSPGSGGLGSSGGRGANGICFVYF